MILHAADSLQLIQFLDGQCEELAAVSSLVMMSKIPLCQFGHFIVTVMIGLNFVLTHVSPIKVCKLRNNLVAFAPFCRVYPSEYAYRSTSVSGIESASANCMNYRPSLQQSVATERFTYCDGTQALILTLDQSSTVVVTAMSGMLRLFITSCCSHSQQESL